MTPGQAAHRKWWDMISSPKVHVDWDNLPPEAQSGWEQIALAAIASYRCRCECHEECGE